MGTIDPVGAFIGGAGNIIGGAINAFTQHKANKDRLAMEKENLAFQKENQAYQRQLQQQIFSREDNAVQRQAKDMELAGLSKNLAAGGGANAGAVINTQAMSQNSSAIQAPQLNIQDMQQMAMSLSQQKLLNAQTDKVKAETGNLEIEGRQGEANILSTEQSIELDKAITELKEKEKELTALKSRTEKEQAELVKAQRLLANANKIKTENESQKAVADTVYRNEEIADARRDRSINEATKMRKGEKRDIASLASALGSLLGEMSSKPKAPKKEWVSGRDK